ncbi:translesion error-prone DNA polymerase V subunit UmuC [Alcanivorax sp.]|uniref:translesion error-prone DNA polymerase V subunit UmuC n=1 Tax=Alcanivorax sp. TaxID=1872427 RepID=UPI000C6C1968|nr:translesion error-prone DNA polymerase V subunit UmuC [Alcanivorax sp.]MBQ24218.1 DNA polymerase V subunit UmuC [Alcanivorax sp.]
MFALVDCNSFYAACERLFRPDLQGQPVVVLSNNDGCIVAGSAEAKALGVKTGMPVHLARDLITRHKILVFSSNYALYGDISQRVMATLETLVPQVEVYSIDEAFLDLSLMGEAELLPLAQQVRARIARWVGVPVCVGIAPTKVLAKLANHAAKRYPATGGTVVLTDPARREKLLTLTPVSRVWGVGRRLSGRLEALGIETALDLARADSGMIRRRFSVVQERLVRELNGEPCLSLDTQPSPRQQVIHSRSFGEPVTALPPLRQALSDFAFRAMESLRKEHLYTGRVTVYLRTAPMGKPQQLFPDTLGAALSPATADTRVVVHQAQALLAQLWKPEYRYGKAGVILTDLRGRDQIQDGLFAQQGEPDDRGNALMTVMDTINQSGAGKVWLAGRGMQTDQRSAWAMRRAHLSPAYTSRWSDLPVVR